MIEWIAIAILTIGMIMLYHRISVVEYVLRHHLEEDHDE